MERIKFITEKLDKLQVKYKTFNKFEDLIIVRIGEKKIYDIFIEYSDTLNAIRFFCIEVYKIPSDKRNKIKNYILNLNYEIVYGSFAIPTNSKFITYTISHSLEDNNEKRNISIEQIEDYLGFFTLSCDNLIDEIEKL